jgi:crotonobetainyl-CoA:carnitine CoA-transferase CaiB-like acyl-CoA transferase
MTKLLEGIRVLEVAIYAFVPSAAAVLADWGADVIKVEDPDVGDPVRGLTAYGFGPGDGGVSALWELFNRGKRSVGINIRKPEGLEILMSLVDQSDVFLTNFMQPARAKLGIDVDQILARNPRIIYGRGTGHGPVGPDANKGGFDALSYWGRPGAGSAAIAPGDTMPVLMPGPAFGDMQCGMHLAGGILGGLYRREKTGKGGVVDVSLLGSGLWAMAASTAGAHVLKSDNIVQLDRRRAPNPIANIYATGDGRGFYLGMLESDRYWPGLCEALGLSGLTQDARFTTSPLRAANSEALITIFDDQFGRLTLVEIGEKLNSQEGPWAVVGRPADVVTDEQALLNGYVQMVDCGGEAQLPMITAPVQYDQDAPTLSRAPGHGEHTDDVMGSLGIDTDNLIRLKVAGVIN